MKLSLVSGIARGLYSEGDVVVALLSARTVGKPDSILVVNVGPDDEDVGFGFLRSEGVSAEILEALIDLPEDTLIYDDSVCARVAERLGDSAWAESISRFSTRAFTGT